MSKSKQIGQAGLVGWRKKVADGVAPRAAERGPFSSEDQARNVIGAVFFAIALYYVVSTIARMVRSARG